MRRGVVQASVLVLLTSGCLMPLGGAARLLVPLPRLGDLVTYVDLQGVQYEIKIQQGHPVRDLEGHLRDSFVVHVRISNVPPQGHPGLDYFVEKATNRIIQMRNPCAVFDKTGTCRAYVLVTWTDGLPWLFGGSVLMGREMVRDARAEVLLPGPRETTLNAPYVVAQTALPSEFLVRPESPPGLTPIGQNEIWGFANASFLFDGGVPYPLEIVHDGANGRTELTRMSYEAGTGPAAVAANPTWTPRQLPGTRDVAEFDGRGPPSTGEEPTSFTLQQARAVAEHNDSATVAFLKDHPQALLVHGEITSTADTGTGVGPASVHQRSTTWTLIYGDLLEQKAHRVAIEKDQWGVPGVPPTYNVTESNDATLPPGLPADPATIPRTQVTFEQGLRSIRELKLNLTEDVPAVVLTNRATWWDEPRYHYSLTYNPEGGGGTAGPAYSVVVRSDTGGLEQALLPLDALDARSSERR